MTVTFECQLDMATMNQRAKYLSQTSFSYKVIAGHVDTHRRRCIAAIVLPGPLEWSTTNTGNPVRLAALRFH